MDVADLKQDQKQGLPTSDNQLRAPVTDPESGEKRYRELFDDSPVAIWVDDWSSVKQMLDTIKGVDNWRYYFDENPDELRKAYKATKVLEVSRAAVKLFNEESIETLLQHSTVEEVIEEELESFLDTLIDFCNHKFSSVIETVDIDGERKEIIIRRHTVVPPAHQKDWSRIIYALEDITERVRLEAQLRQSQKMEMVGQLTGGVAHDFNNILAVIQGNAQLLNEGIGDASENIEAILSASNRAAELTRRLLVFSRKHHLEPTAIDLNILISNMSDLLASSLGETIDVQYNVETDLWPVFADAGQVENALLNLALNARDAMQKGGLLTIECSNIYLDADYIPAEQVQDGYIAPHISEFPINTDFDSGDYVSLSVSDNGQGMTEATLSQVFEPFFTTKAVGAGTGLGLSMVYNFVKQSNGHIEISSKLGEGTHLTLYLKRADRVDIRVSETDPKLENKNSRQGHILLLEDDDGVRRLVSQMLRQLGHSVVATSRVSEAETALAATTSFDLLLSDVVLPGGSSGPEFARKALIEYPDLKCMFMSGYASQSTESTKIDKQWKLLHKPFSMEQLTNALLNELD
jgi:signal transduction histidine kinase/CheY-like chemotaxis protein